PVARVFIERVTLMCFGASYAVALVLELIQLFRPRPVQRLAAAGMGCAGLLAHTLFLAFQHHKAGMGSQFGSILYLAWILAVFYVYGSIHHRQVAWGVFVLPVVLGLVALAAVFTPSKVPDGSQPAPAEGSWTGYWAGTHVVLLLLAAVGVCV